MTISNSAVVVTGASHHQLLRAFVSDPLLASALERAEAGRYLLHELGDSMLVLPLRA